MHSPGVQGGQVHADRQEGRHGQEDQGRRQPSGMMTINAGPGAKKFANR